MSKNSRVYYVSDDQGERVKYRSVSPKAAAQRYVREGNYGSYGSYGSYGTNYVHVAVIDAGGNMMSYAIVAAENTPPCAQGRKRHAWLQESIQGHGGGVKVAERCLHCNRLRITDTWAQSSSTGEMLPFDVVAYEED